MAAIPRDSGLPSFLPVTPAFDFFDDVQIEAPAAWEVMAAMQDYEENVRQEARDWADRRGRELWEANKPWYCHL